MHSIAKTKKIISEIASFTQHSLVSLYEAWERYKELLRKCPHHGLLDWVQLQTFYNGLTNETKTLVDVVVDGSLMEKNIENA